MLSAMPSDTDREEAEDAALRAWSLVHGLSMMMLDGRMPADDHVIETLLKR